MKYLAFDTSSNYLTVIASKEEKFNKLFINNATMQHSVLLMEAIENTLQTVSMDVSEIDVVASVVGPGSFTGIRIGVSTAKGLCSAHNIKALNITSFEVIAYASKVERVLSIIDAMHNNYYIAAYENHKLIFSPKFVNKDELLSYKDKFSFISAQKIEGIETEVVDVCLGLKNAVENNINKADNLSLLTPFYLRLSQAEEGRK